MSNSTYSPIAFPSAAQSSLAALVSLARELFSVTPLAVMMQALKAPSAQR